MTFGKLIIVVVTAFLAGTGCVSSRDVIKLELPEYKDGTASATKQIYIRTVQDERVFEERPIDPTIPSLKGGLRKNPEDIRKRAVARKRDEGGRVSGDVILSEEQTVEMIISQLMQQSLTSANYKVVESAKSPNTTVMDVTINRFWSWMLPNIFTNIFGAEIAVTVSVKQGDKQYKFPITADIKKNGQIVTPGSWKNVYKALIEKYIQNSRTVLETNLH